MFPELVEHPCLLTNMRGLYSDVIADHVFGYVLCFARNFHHYIRNQLEARWAPVGGKAESSVRAVAGRADARAMTALARRSRWASSPAPPTSAPSISRISTWRTPRSASWDSGRSAPRSPGAGSPSECAVLAVDPIQTAAPPGIATLWRLDRLPDLLGDSDFVVIAAPAHARDSEALPSRPVPADEAERLSDQHRARGHRRPGLTSPTRCGRPDRPAPASMCSRPSPCRRPPALGDANVIITPHVAGDFPADRRAAPRRPPGQRRPFRARRAARHRRRQAPLVLTGSDFDFQTNWPGAMGLLRSQSLTPWISRAVRRPDSIAPWIQAWASEACSPAKWMRPSGATIAS